MFGRVAAWGVAACLVVWPAAAAVEYGTFADANAVGGRITSPVRHDGNIPIVPLRRDEVPSTWHDEAETRPDVAPEMALHVPDQIDDDGQLHAGMAAFDPAEPKIAAPPLSEPFGLTATPVASGDVVVKWNGVEAAIRNDRAILGLCRENSEVCPKMAQDFLAVITEGRALGGRSRVGVINRAINMAIQPMSDMAQWGVPDRWSPPLETFRTGRGDCEDYAIAKYVALTEAGVAAEDVRLVIVRNTAAREDHAVVAVHLGGDWIMLDNRWLTLIEDADMPQAVPLFVLDGAGVRKFAPAAVASLRRPARPASLDF